MKNKKIINWGMIGCGDVTEVKSGPGLYKSENSNLLGLYNRTYDKAISYANRHSISKVFKSDKELIEDNNIDIVYIATPPNTHFEYAKLALEAGKIPYIEKPMVVNYLQAKRLEALSEKYKITPYVAFYRRGLEKFKKIKEILESKVLGDIKFVNIKHLKPVEDIDKSQNKPWRIIPEISGGGKFLDVGTHVLDCLIWFLGEIEDISGFVTNVGGYYSADDTVTASFKFKNGAIGSGLWCFVADRELCEVEITGENGNIIYDGLSDKNFLLTINNKTTEYNFNSHEHIAMPYEQSIVNELTFGYKSNANFKDAINLVKICDSLYNQ